MNGDHDDEDGSREDLSPANPAGGPRAVRVPSPEEAKRRLIEHLQATIAYVAGEDVVVCSYEMRIEAETAAFAHGLRDKFQHEPRLHTTTLIFTTRPTK